MGLTGALERFNGMSPDQIPALGIRISSLCLRDQHAIERITMRSRKRQLTDCDRAQGLNWQDSKFVLFETNVHEHFKRLVHDPFPIGNLDCHFPE